MKFVLISFLFVYVFIFELVAQSGCVQQFDFKDDLSNSNWNRKMGVFRSINSPTGRRFHLRPIMA
jgi:hypothetical protein